MTRGTRLAVLGVLAMQACAFAQPGGPQAPQPGERNPKYLELTNPRYYTLNSRVMVHAYQERNYTPQDRGVEFDVWEFQFAAIVFPMPEQTGTSYQDKDAPMKSTVTIDDKEWAAGSPHFITQFPVGARYGLWEVRSPDGQSVKAREMNLSVSYPEVTHRTKYYDEAAEQVDWPQGPWPDDAASSLSQPMSYVDHDPQHGPYNMEGVRALISQWCNKQDPKKLKPAVLAKFLAGKVAQHVQVSGRQLMAGPNGMLEGVKLNGAEVTAQEGKGTPFELACLLAAVYREAGLPARTVIGVKAGKSKKDLDFIDPDKNKGDLHVWVEFCLYDETDKTVTWVPVDIIEIRASSSRFSGEYWAKPMRYFGTNDKIDDYVPLSFHFFPPTTVRSYGGSGTPGFWGWFVGPVSPARAEQSLWFQVTSTPARAGQNRGNRNER